MFSLNFELCDYNQFHIFLISAVQSPLNVLLGLESMPKIVGGMIIAGDSSNARVTLLKKLPDLDNYTPTDYQYTPEYSIDDEEYSIY